MTTVAVVRFPGVNCEAETVRALERVGLGAEILNWTSAPGSLRAFPAFVIPGGFSYQDRVRGGALAAKHPIMDVLADEAARGKPLLGICNGAQVLVEAGLVPNDGTVELALARNRSTGRSGYYARWIYARVEESPCVFTRALEPGAVLPLPVAHAEGRFTGAPGRMDALLRSGQVPLRYADADGALAEAFPDNPNGSEAGAAAVCNGRGNVLAIMPHPERAQDLAAMPPAIEGAWARAREDLAARDGGAVIAHDGPGLELFRGLRIHLEEA